MDKIRELMRMTRFFLKAFPALILASQVLVPCYDWLRPWGSAVDQLSRAGVVVRFCVGMSSVTMIHGSNSTTERSRTFVAVADYSILPRLITIEAAAENLPATLDDGGPGWVLAWCAVVGVCSFLTWRWWIRPYHAAGLEGLRLAI